MCYQISNILYIPALRVIPSHSYALTAIDDNQVIGYPNLNTHGDLKAEDDDNDDDGKRISLDGSSTWMDAHFKYCDCILDPGCCPDGFTVSLKVNINPAMKNMTEAKYILDSGAHGGSSRGISMYVKSGKLHYHLTTKDKTWTVSVISVYTNKSKVILG